MASSPGPAPIENDEAERLALEAAIAEARGDTRPSLPHEIVRAQLLSDEARARDMTPVC